MAEALRQRRTFSLRDVMIRDLPISLQNLAFMRVVHAPRTTEPCPVLPYLFPLSFEMEFGSPLALPGPFFD